MTRAIITFVCPNSRTAETLAASAKEHIEDRGLTYSNLNVSFVANYRIGDIPQIFDDGSSPEDYI